MRKQILLLFVVMSFAFAACEEDSDSDAFLYKVPSELEAYVDLHFPEQTIIQAVWDAEGEESNYELLLDNLTRLEFGLDKKVIEIGGSSKLPDSVIPAGILSYISSNYESQHIIGWELEAGYQQIELNNQLELEFDMDGKFVRTDD